MNTPKIVQLHRGWYWEGSKRLLNGPFATSHDAHVDWSKNSPSDLVPQYNGISQALKREEQVQEPLFEGEELLDAIYWTYRNVSEGIGV